MKKSIGKNVLLKKLYNQHLIFHKTKELQQNSSAGSIYLGGSSHFAFHLILKFSVPTRVMSPRNCRLFIR